MVRTFLKYLCKIGTSETWYKTSSAVSQYCLALRLECFQQYAKSKISLIYLKTF
jgi:hypothetical protein